MKKRRRRKKKAPHLIIFPVVLARNLGMGPTERSELAFAVLITRWYPAS